MRLWPTRYSRRRRAFIDVRTREGLIEVGGGLLDDGFHAEYSVRTPAAGGGAVADGHANIGADIGVAETTSCGAGSGSGGAAHHERNDGGGSGSGDVPSPEGGGRKRDELDAAARGRGDDDGGRGAQDRGGDEHERGGSVLRPVFRGGRLSSSASAAKEAAAAMAADDWVGFEGPRPRRSSLRRRSSRSVSPRRRDFKVASPRENEAVFLPQFPRTLAWIVCDTQHRDPTVRLLAREMQRRTSV